ncbi:MAG TPA: DUF3048 domain-containing protein [Streptosporangiaceae bacterium]|nr:DUF3048 domain-containing protein [Streptosporangiaceae bacterium]
MSERKGRITVAVAAVTVFLIAMTVAVALALRGDGDGDGVVAPPAPGTSTPPRTSPFTGLPSGADKPVLAVKIDNVAPARPQTGLDKADLVYIEPVEAGLSRILAVFSSRTPSSVGPVRSARESDLELLRQFGRPALAYSGAQSKLRPLIARAPLYDVSPGRAPGAYVRDGSRRAPHNLYGNPARLLQRAPAASKARDIGFRFGAAPPGGTLDAGQTVRYGAATVQFRWSAAQDRWLAWLDGTPATSAGGTRLGAPTVVIQYVTVRSSRFKDRGGNVSPYTETVGSGSALVLRDGRTYQARWSRPDDQVGTTFTTRTGAPMTFHPGPVWIVFAPRA